MDYIKERRLLDVLSLAYQNFEHFEQQSKQSNSGCLRDMFIYIRVSFSQKGILDLYISAWASALLVQTTAGSSKALISGTSNRYRFPRFFYYSLLSLLLNRPVRDLRAFIRQYYYEKNVFSIFYFIHGYSLE